MSEHSSSHLTVHFVPDQLIFFFPRPFLADLFVCIFFYLSYFHCGTRICRWRTAPSNGSIVRHPPLINEWIWGIGGMINGRKNSQVLVRGLCTSQHFMLQIPYGHSLDWTRTLALRNRRLIDVTRHSIFPSFTLFVFPSLITFLFVSTSPFYDIARISIKVKLSTYRVLLHYIMQGVKGGQLIKYKNNQDKE